MVLGENYDFWVDDGFWTPLLIVARLAFLLGSVEP
tara:strand:- start:184 stop:288 length:105 start_codon:yes stop_codon:yes gene_type:complete